MNGVSCDILETASSSPRGLVTSHTVLLPEHERFSQETLAFHVAAYDIAPNIKSANCVNLTSMAEAESGRRSQFPATIVANKAVERVGAQESDVNALRPAKRRDCCEENSPDLGRPCPAERPHPQPCRCRCWAVGVWEVAWCVFAHCWLGWFAGMVARCVSMWH